MRTPPALNEFAAASTIALSGPVAAAMPEAPQIVPVEVVENDTDYGVAGRVEYLVAGDWKPYGDLTALGNKDGTFTVVPGKIKESVNALTKQLMELQATLHELDPESSMPILGKEAREDRVWRHGPRLELGVELARDEPGVIG